MAERFSDIEKPLVSKQPGLEERLKEYPELKTKIETMLAIIENAGGDVKKAAEAERRIIEELRQMGNEVLHGWACRQQQKMEEEYGAKPGVNRKEKKLYWYTRPGKIEIAEQIFNHGPRRPQIRPFSESAEVKCRGYSEALQRASTDFGADDALCQSGQAKRTLWDLRFAVSAICGFTEGHGAAKRSHDKQKSDGRDQAGVPVLIAEMDDSMLPVVEVKTENLKKMIALRVWRAKRGWADCWNNMHQAAA
jgi:hypothetical protein